MDLPEAVEVVVEVPRGGLVKWTATGRVRFVSPVPCPFNYGSVLGTRGPDGDPLDAIVLGPRLPRGSVGRWSVWGSVPFVDRGLDDTKLVCGPTAPTDQEWRRVRGFFQVYGAIKRVLPL